MTREARKPKTKPGQFKKRKRKPCFFCIEQTNLDYKDAGFVRRFMTDRGKIAPRRLSGCCAEHQRMVAKAIKRARQIGAVPYVVD
ncbi:30S ribosomal protein S18 [candidate division WOR-1 bacterium RIFCSPHIGHO2_01_FULL_53_15]|uniref:Small ribosomal subunit protein bS18 n=1 Tax=candidate division WOR-1 bacterium RIFCSPHIGHO2_01_FULL_53_15 TaxID=1802564 RepID=A0A1F4Q1Q8_UNCSA|nr:MAG: 30S ribosomal protein S18 [candidate division WOR-1 bacterium RIFCSPHIGHO2_01_FULL_53_15]OGC13116.1 MAG: 30S ribosomal protein S18 [candidate division WOR-1 bacterium RIFCSPHIGHO2_02_FULL_53_26]